MKRTILTMITAVAVGLLGGLTVGCGGGGSGGGGGGASTAAGATGTGQLEVQLTDAPLQDLSRVKLAQVTVERVEVHVASVGSSTAAVTSGQGKGQGNGQPAGVGFGMTVTPSGNVLPDNAHGGNPNARGGNPNAGGANAAAVSSSAGGASTAAVSSNAGGNGQGANNAKGGTWLTIFDAAQAGAPKVYNLLDLRGGITAELAKVSLPAGNYTHIKLVVSAAELIVDTTSYSTANGKLDLPSGEIQISFSGKNAIVVTAGQTTQVLLDFDVGRSFNSVGPPSNPTRFTLLPTIRGANLAMSGSLAGAVESDNLTPANAADDAPLSSVTVTAVRPGEQVTTYSDAQGAYFLAGLDEGSWDVTFSDPAHTDQTITVTITKAQQTTQDVLLVKK